MARSAADYSAPYRCLALLLVFENQRSRPKIDLLQAAPHPRALPPLSNHRSGIRIAAH